MTDTGIRYTHCRGPHCGGRKLLGLDIYDGLCSGDTGDNDCYGRFREWVYDSAPHVDAFAIVSIEWSVAIDQWLEAGAP